ncbi:hypothetical protein L1987_16173 [Smallanthus sonchifolius]|uniref:Uncharacterized protein n=1 Tax=Smallanthus sonchifolius TaxID=185202 RepID=A0ACB9J9R2_9ASTR|nr:hypothetical protein L1987_16173 [Smallanthus sonchifolius]
MDRHEWSMIGADCLVLSCCCQCLILQILVFVLLKLPIKLCRKIKVYVKRKFGIRRKAVLEHCAAAVMGRQRRRPPCRVAEEGARWEESSGCMEEVEEVLGEMCNKGEFGFGSFWTGDDDDSYLEDDFRVCFVNQQLGYHDHDGKYHFIKVFGPLIMQLI